MSLRTILIASAIAWGNLFLLAGATYVGLRVAGVVPLVTPVAPADDLSDRFAALKLPAADAAYISELFAGLADRLEADAGEQLQTVQQLHMLIAQTGKFALDGKYPELGKIPAEVFSSFPTSGPLDAARRKDAVERLRKLAEAVQ